MLAVVMLAQAHCYRREALREIGLGSLSISFAPEIERNSTVRRGCGPGVVGQFLSLSSRMPDTVLRFAPCRPRSAMTRAERTI